MISPSQVDPLGVVIVSGYLQGKINAYRFATEDSVVKWGPKKIEPKPWDPKKFYLFDDVVEYHGKAYRAFIDTQQEPPNDWILEPLRDPVSILRYFPALTDTLPKSEFLKRMIEESMMFTYWDPQAVYFFGDFVEWNGKAYQSLTENVGKNPEENPDHWSVSNQGGIVFNQLKDLNRTGILFNYVVNNSDTTWHPLMVTVYKRGIDIPLPVAYFYYQDVVNYLNSIPLPVVSTTGYAPAANFVFAFDDASRAAYQHWIKMKIQSGALKPASKDIHNIALYRSWLADAGTGKDHFQTMWQLQQQLVTKDILITKVDSVREKGIVSRPVLSIPFKAIEKLYKREKIPAPKMITYRNMLTDFHNWIALHEAHYIDSLKPFNFEIVNRTTAATRYFVVEKYQARIDSGNVVASAFLSEAWPWIEQSFNSGKIRERNPPHSFFPDTYNWSAGNPWQVNNHRINLDKDFHLSSQYNSTTDTLVHSKGFLELNVYYRKDINTNMSLVENYFQPIYISVIYKTDKPYDISVCFDWKEFKALLTKTNLPETDKFIHQVEGGTLQFYSSELRYLLMEERN